MTFILGKPEAICDTRNNSPEDIENNVLNMDIELPVVEIVKPGPASDWTLDNESIKHKTVEALGISEGFLRGEATYESSTDSQIIVSPRLEQSIRDARVSIEKRMIRFLHKNSKPKAVRGGAILPANGMKFRSLRLARLWWKQLPMPTIKWSKPNGG